MLGVAGGGAAHEDGMPSGPSGGNEGGPVGVGAGPMSGLGIGGAEPVGLVAGIGGRAVGPGVATGAD